MPRLRHVVIFTDGLTVDLSGPGEAVHEAAAACITRSVVKAGQGSPGQLFHVAASGGNCDASQSRPQSPDVVAVELEQTARPPRLAPEQSRCGLRQPRLRSSVAAEPAGPFVLPRR